MVFSWAHTLDMVLAMKLRHAHTLAQNQDREWKLKHPDETRDAVQKNFTKLDIRIKKEFNDHVNRAKQRRQRLLD